MLIPGNGRAVTTLEKRIETLERLSLLKRAKEQGRGPVEQMNHGTADLLAELQEMTQEAKLITRQAAGDPRTALASIRVRCCIVELAAKLRGHLDERNPTNILNVNIDSETARRIAETYLERHKQLEEESK